MAAELNCDTVVIGTTLSALKYAQENKCTVLFNREPSLFSYRKLETGEFEYIAWQDTASAMAIQGLIPFSDKITSIRINEDTISVLCRNKKYTINYKNIVFFDDKNIENFPFEKVPVQEYLVCDWFQVTSGAKHDYWILEDEDKFVNKIHFIPKITLPKYKDCVSESYIAAENLNHIDFTPAMARIKTAQIMKSAGVLGTKHTKTYYYPIKLKFLERQVFEIKEQLLKQKDNYTLDTREFK